MSFDPAKPRPQRWVDEAIHIGPDFAETWQSILDPASDTLYRFGYNGGDGFTINVLDLKTKTWVRKQSGATAGGKPISAAPAKSHLAFDPVARAFYAVDSFTGRLLRYRVAADVLDDLGLIPGGPFPANWNPADATLWSMIAWDSRHSILLFVRNTPAGFFAYHPTTRTWESLPPTTDPPGATLPFVRSIVYHPLHDVFAMLDINSAQLFLYRYAGTDVPRRQ